MASPENAETLLQGLKPDQYNQLKNAIREVVKEVVGEVVRAEMANYRHKCRLDMSTDEMRAVSSFAHRMKQMGGGDVQQGFDTIYENHKWMKAQRELGVKASLALLFLFLTGLVSGTVAALWLGFKTLVKSNGAG